MVNMNSSSIFMNAMYGLQNAYTGSLQDGADSVSRKDLLDAQQKSFLNGTTPFTSYMSTNFMNLDSNQDGLIAADEMQQMMNDISSAGLTYEQMMQFGMSGSVDSKQISEVLQNFTKVDKNGDGKVSTAEINYYLSNKEMEDKIAELKDRNISNMSIMYDIDPEDYEG